jgi:hypothetical protein
MREISWADLNKNALALTSETVAEQLGVNRQSNQSDSANSKLWPLLFSRGAAPQVQPPLLTLSAIISQYLTRGGFAQNLCAKSDCKSFDTLQKLIK